MPSNRDDIRDFLNRRKHVVLVEVKSASGSTPREAGAWMLVAVDCIFGTIGGGQLEFMAIDHARRLLSEGGADADDISVPLGPEIGQCCGGRVALGFKRVDRPLRSALVEKVDREIAHQIGVHPLIFQVLQELAKARQINHARRFGQQAGAFGSGFFDDGLQRF